jgi:3-oxoacyl-[acyl-carrier-protein] synthase II
MPDPTSDPVRVVITGMGVITALGQDPATLWQNLLAGKTATRGITRFDAGRYQTRIASEIDDFDPEAWMDRREARRFDRVIQFSVAAVRQALDQADLRPEGELADEIGVIVGTGVGGLSSVDQAAAVLAAGGPMRVSPLTAVNMLPDMSSGQVAISFGLRGPNFCVISACATGSNVIGEAAEIIRRGDAVAMVAAGSEAPICPLGLAAFHRTGSLSTRNDEPERASRPFDADRDGFVVAEGAGAVVLERLEFALARGATPIAELTGYATTADAFHVSAPDAEGRGAAKAMTRALARAGLEPGELDYINAHGTSTPLNDRSETIAIKKALGEAAYTIPISSSKSMLGHLLGAAGVVEAIVCAQTINNGVIPPTINYETPDPECDLDFVPNVPREARVRTAMSNSFGFGGHNATLVLAAVD